MLLGFSSLRQICSLAVWELECNALRRAARMRVLSAEIETKMDNSSLGIPKKKLCFYQDDDSEFVDMMYIGQKHKRPMQVQR